MDDSIDIFDGQDSITSESKISDNAKKNFTSWADKYRPKTIDDMVLDEKTKTMLKEMISKGDIQNMSLCGSCGKGKTTLAKVLVREVNAETLFIPCGTDGTADIVRNRIQPFCESASSGRLKCVILDEFDSASGGNAAANGMQKALRSLMESFVDTRFIITCNYPKKIIAPIFSRCPQINIGFTLRDVCIRLMQIWKMEGINYDSQTAKEFASKYVYKMMPDIRSIIKLAQLYSSSGTLKISEDAKINTSSNSITEFSNKIIDGILSKTDYRTLRQTVINNSSIYQGDYEILISAISECIVNRGLNKDAIPMLSEFAFRMSQVHDPSLQIVAALISLGDIL